jgi:RNA-directed DNA polymerase
MNAEQQKRIPDLASGQEPVHHGADGDGGTEAVPPEARQTFTALDQQRALTSDLMDQVCNPQNILRAYRRVRANKGSPGVDGMTVHQLADWLREHSEALIASLRNGTYQPQPVRGVEIPKSGGGKRQLGIPIVVDRLVQQMFLQVLDPSSIRPFRIPASASDLGAVRMTRSNRLGGM